MYPENVSRKCIHKMYQGNVLSLCLTLKAGGFLIAAMGKARLRLVTHHQVTQSDAEKVVLAFSNYLHAV